MPPLQLTTFGEHQAVHSSPQFSQATDPQIFGLFPSQCVNFFEPEPLPTKPDEFRSAESPDEVPTNFPNRIEPFGLKARVGHEYRRTMAWHQLGKRREELTLGLRTTFSFYRKRP